MKDNDWKGTGTLVNKNTITINDKAKGQYEVTDLVLSISRTVKEKEQETLVPIEAWGEMSKHCGELAEGDKIEIRGYFKSKKWKNSKGSFMSKNLIVAEKITRL